MIDYVNPFEYEQANKFTDDQILDFFIEDFNYSRFIRSRRNIFLFGERGTGKTMTLLYNSFPVQRRRTQRTNEATDYSLICVYVPCNTPLTHKREYELLEPYQAAVISEHFLVLSMMYEVADTLSVAPELLENTDIRSIRQQLALALDINIPEGGALFDAMKLIIQSEVTRSQKALNARVPDAFYDNAVSFSSAIVPFITLLRNLPLLKETHFAFMLDDAHDLNRLQIATLNSWIAYRDNSLFSFKVAAARIGATSYKTASGGAILEGHDFTSIDIEQPYQNQYSAFGKLAREIVLRRLAKVSVDKSPDAFFPTSPEFDKDLKECEERVRQEAHRKYPQGTAKQIGDYVYKYGRSEYFRKRSPRANRPPYSGFDMLVHISTGVIRNMLEPCYWMYDRVVSETRAGDNHSPRIEEISPAIQTSIILERSKKKWAWIEEGLDKSIEGCSREQARWIFQLFNQLAILFRERLLKHGSEPRAITFTISDQNFSHLDELKALLDIARRAQILYEYRSSSKDSGQRETYYTPNRILWPDRGLDPHGQNARVSIQARHLWAAATQNKAIPFDAHHDDAPLGELFDGNK